ncbi:MAG TPA: AAA family ATPase [Solirubrobacteraceae bacterium]|nr:AAA family ATPase [Solirubrobacteraceae bacterium]
MIETSRTVAGSELVGREVEIERVEALIDHLQDEGGALVIRGEAGIGKSALLDRARTRATGLGARALTTVGVESEAEFALAALHQLIRPIAPLIERLRAPQRQALESAFGIGDEVEPDPFLVALAAYELVWVAADEGPLALIVDDAHWLDRSSLGVLTFIARRIEGGPVVLVAAVREGYSTSLEEAGLPTLQVDRLSASAAAELLDRSAPDLHPVARARVLAEAAGNPLALVELGQSLLGATDADDRLSPAPTSLTGRLERAFASRLDALPAETGLLLLAAALDTRASLEEVMKSAALVHEGVIELTALDPAVAVGLVEIVDAGVQFHHPLIRSAVQQAATPARVLAMYGALAAVVADHERALWHRAMSAVGYDEEIAAALEEHAHRARRRGAVTVAAAALERAALLTADPTRKGERLVQAAEVAFELGLVDVVRRLLTQAEPLDVGSLEAARLAWLQQMVSGNVWVEKGAAKTFVGIAQQMLKGGDADMALRSLVPIAHRCWWTRSQPRTREYVVDTAENVGVADDDPRLLAVIALAHPELTGPVVLKRVAGIRLHQVADPVASMYAGIAAEKAGDFAMAAPFLARAVERLRERGQLGMLTQALVHHAWVATYIGDWGVAAAAGAEAARWARDSRQPQYGLTGELIAALASALRGGEDLEAMLATPEQTLLAMRAGPLLAPAHLARGAAALGEGSHEEAFGHLWPVFDENAPAFHRFMRWPAVLDLVEAGGRGEHAEAVARVVNDLAELVKRSAPPILRVGLSCSWPLTAPDGEAEPLFVAALGQDLTGYPFFRARTLFGFGRWLRRQRRSSESRAPLREAIDLFDALGATRWSERARQELRATGESIGHRTPDARDRLTAQELQIAELASHGLSNREIGERLLLSHRTIGSHLYRIFPKLEISSRAQLRDALAEATLPTNEAVG